MRNGIVLAAAVLSVLTGLLTVGYAQTSHDGPDAFELRRELIDKIEDAYAAGDIATLRRMVAAKRLHEQLHSPTPNASSDKPTAVTSNVSAPGKAYGIAILWDWLQNQLCDDIAENMSSCDDDYNQCLEDAFYSDIGDPNNADTVVKAQDCEINYLLCQLDQNKMSSACQWLLPLAPVPGDSPEPPGTVTPER